MKNQGKMVGKVVVAVALVLLLSTVTGCEKKQDNGLVHFEGGVLTVEDVEAHRQSMKRMKEFRNNPEQLTPAFVLEHAINMEMIIAKGLEMKLHQDPRIREHLHKHMSETFLRVMGEQLVPPVEREDISDEESLAYYQTNIENYQDKPQYKLHAFSVEEEQLQEVKELLDGGMDFADAAVEYASTDRQKRKRGYTGMRALERFQTAWQPVVEALEIGKISGPTEIDGEHYFLLLEEKTEMHQYSFEEKKEYVRNDLLHNRYRQAWQAVYDQLREDYKVEINEDNFSAFELKHSLVAAPANETEG